VRKPGPSFRVRLTVSYAALLVAGGLVLFAVLLLVLRYVPDRSLAVIGSGDFAPDRGDLLEVAVRLTGLGLALLAVTGLVAGWVVAGRMLRPLDRITRAARSAGHGSLSHRIALPGRDDELRRLADTFDQMLEQLERSFEEQRRFSANVSHELRTPQTVVKTMLEVAQADPDAVHLPTLLARLREMNDRSIDTHEALLNLARAERGNLSRRPCDLAEVTGDVLRSCRTTTEVEVHDTIGAAGTVLVEANPPLLRQLADNLIRNAVLHNLPAGGTVWVDVTADEGGRARLRVANTGPVIPAETAATLTEPFVRVAARTRPVQRRGGTGLGLAIVASVARAHRADLSIEARPEGGLTVTVTFPPASLPPGRGA
jgi:two-component system, OmpR family, sensor histidine kinase VanS